MSEREAGGAAAGMLGDLRDVTAALEAGGLVLPSDGPAAPAEWTTVGPGGLVPADVPGSGGGAPRQTGTDYGKGRPTTGPGCSESAAGLYPHYRWRPRAGYAPVDTAGVDALRPVGQRELLAVLDRRDRAREERSRRRKAAASRRPESPGPAAGGGVQKGFSFTEHLRHQAAIKAFLRAEKRRRVAGAAAAG